MANKKDVLTVNENEEVLAKIIKLDEGKYAVEDADGVKEITKTSKDGAFALPKNASNRQWIRISLVEEAFAGGAEYIPLTYKATKHIGSTGSRIPNAKLIEYLNEEEKAEYLAIIEKAKAAMEADKEKPMTEEEKLKAKIAKYQEALAKLKEAQAE